MPSLSKEMQLYNRYESASKIYKNVFYFEFCGRRCEFVVLMTALVGRTNIWPMSRQQTSELV